MDYKEIMQKLGRINLLHRLYFYRVTANKNIYMGQLPIIMYVIDHDSCTQKDMVDKFLISAPSIATSIKRLQKAGYITKKTDKADSRLTRLSATDKAHKLSDEMKKEFERVNNLSFSNFSEQESRELDRLITKMLDALNTDEFRNKDIQELVKEEKHYQEDAVND